MAKIKEFFEKFKGKKRIELVVASVLIVIILIVYFSSSFAPFSSSDDDQSSKSAGNLSTQAIDYGARLEEKLNALLSSVKGAGKVRAIIHFESSSELIIAYIESKSDSSSSSTPSTITVNGSQTPIILKEIYPKVKGVLICAQGASDPKVKIDLINCASTLLSIATTLIYVTTMA